VDGLPDRLDDASYEPCECGVERMVYHYLNQELEKWAQDCDKDSRLATATVAVRSIRIGALRDLATLIHDSRPVNSERDKDKKGK
jgi:hypothetical protein